MKVVIPVGTEIDDTIRMAKQYDGIFSKIVKVNLDHAIPEYKRFIQNGIGVMFALKDDAGIHGGIAGIKYPDLNSGDLTAVECFWYVNEDKRGEGVKLLAAFEEWAENQNCSKIAVIHLVDSFPDRLEKIYNRRGYKLVEKHYVKEI